MKVLVVFAALVAVACSAPSAVIGSIAPGAVVRGAQAVLAGPSGTVVADTGAVVSGGAIAPAVVSSPVVVAGPSVLSHGLVAPGLVAPGLVAPGLIGLNGLNGLGLHSGLVGLGGHGVILG